MKRINEDLKCCNVCHDSLPLKAFYEQKNTCIDCEREREVQRLGGRLNVQPYLDGWER